MGLETCKLDIVLLTEVLGERLLEQEDAHLIALGVCEERPVGLEPTSRVAWNFVADLRKEIVVVVCIGRAQIPQVCSEPPLVCSVPATDGFISESYKLPTLVLLLE